MIDGMVKVTGCRYTEVFLSTLVNRHTSSVPKLKSATSHYISNFHEETFSYFSACCAGTARNVLGHEVSFVLNLLSEPP